ncbi:TPA: baseplate J/gp47 family protein [Escherichia coli]
MATIKYGVTENGFVRKPVADVVSSLNNKFIAAFGSNFDISPESPDGQYIGIMADEIASCWEQAEQVFNAFRPGAVSGIGLDNVCELTNTVRYVDKPSQATVLCDGDMGTTVPAGSIVTDGTMRFILDTDVTLPGDVTVIAEEPGEYYVAPRTINQIVTPVAGWNSVINETVGETGINYESDPQLRARREKTTAVSSTATVEAIYASLADLDIDYIRVRDNDTGSPIGNQPSGTVFVVVDGGTSNDIARRIYNAKTGGVPTYGDITITVADSKGYPHDIHFSRPTYTDIYVKGTFRRRANANISSNDAIRQLTDATIEYLNSLQPGQSVVWSNMFAPIMAATQYLEIDSLFIGIAPNPTGIATIELDIDKRARGVAANITYTDVTV